MDSSAPLSSQEAAILKKAWDHYGPQKQFDQCIEEMSELCQELLHARRPGSGLNIKEANWTPGILEELADVIICIQQIRLALELIRPDPKSPENSLWDEVNDIRHWKIARLEGRLQQDLLRADPDMAYNAFLRPSSPQFPHCVGRCIDPPTSDPAEPRPGLRFFECNACGRDTPCTYVTDDGEAWPVRCPRRRPGPHGEPRRAEWDLAERRGVD